LSLSDPTLEARALALLDEALEQPSAERGQWMKDRIGADTDLGSRLEALLAAADRRGGALMTGGAGEGLELEPPERIGAYRLIERLGQGGMGAVYRAERQAGDFKHAVAIKIIRPGVLSEALIERFQRERQTLADLAHPHIARLFDGGETPDGQPFIIMELVEGEAITDWADARQLGAPARLALFLDACEAVRFAHQNLIVHRDLTPSNVLVTPEGAVKLIDFGIARPPEEHRPPTGDTVAAMSLTPGFAAPERMAGETGSTLVDVYSLGRLLQELMAALPHDADIDAIGDKAARADPKDRYPSVDALIQDVRRYLEGRPVSARGGGRRYALLKFIRRHGRVVAASVTGVALLISALGVTLVAYASAERARAAEAERFQQVRALATWMLFDHNDRLARTPGNTAARVRLAAEAQRYLTVLAAGRRVAADVRLDTARGFIRLAQIQGVPPDPNFGEHAKAKENLAQADRALADLANDGRDLSVIAPERARVAAYGALIAVQADKDTGRAKQLIAESERRLASTPAAGRGESWHRARRAVLHSRTEVAYISDDLGQIESLIPRYEADARSWPASLQRSELAVEDRAFSSYWRGAVAAGRNQPGHGIDSFLEARRLFAAAEAARPNDPHLLYWRAYNEYELFAAAAREERFSISTDALMRARSTLARLLAVEDADQALKTLAVNMDEAYGQDLANHNRFREAIDVQKGVVTRVTDRLATDRSPSAVSQAGWSEMILGLNAKKAGDRALTCAAWTRAEKHWTSVEPKLTEFYGGFLPGLRRNLKLCADGKPLSAFGPIR
jgi:serine/threonine-protein kinase